MPNSHKGLASLIIVGVIVVGCAVVSIVSQKYLGPNNAIENEAEEIIEEETGVKVDFSPSR